MEGLSIKGPANLSTPIFKNTLDLGYYFSKRAFLAFKKSYFSKFIKKAEGAPITLLVIFLAPENALRCPKDILDRSERTRATDNGKGETDLKRE